MSFKRKSTKDSDSDEDETFYFRYASAAAPPSSSSSSSSRPNSNQATTKSSAGGGGSGGLAPSKSTLYLSNLDFSLTNSDIHTLFSTLGLGKIARVTVLKDRVTRNSKGVAFVQFVSREDALAAESVMHGKVLNGRTLRASIAVDNGRAPEFIKKRIYKDKSKCYECGDSGHLSYECPKNQFGPRERPVPKKVRRGGGGSGREKREYGGDSEEEESDGGEGIEEENWASAVDGAAEERLRKAEMAEAKKKKKMTRKASYFSDESDEEE